MTLKEMNNLRTYLLNKSEKMNDAELNELRAYFERLVVAKSETASQSQGASVIMDEPEVELSTQDTTQEKTQQLDSEPNYETVSSEYTN